ncbi:hypothetical protein SCP_0201640 [Sparassis crispa]|uniref:DUF6534 domain-containing protein n=1 Tax=Sparassis crispa TaxID=139825 RepID=A0A401G9Z1_9APHY|nr:hypothetical protein SCP_0201640 [Sparassis crispa]GBE78967.1 hypothetical protein SCP_0201640 [Sparassis crispa]
MASLDSLIESTLGYQFIGFTVATSCYGITVIQIYLYYCNCKEDGRTFKAFVYFLFFLDTLCSALVSHALYVVLIVDWGNTIGLERFPWSFALENGVTVLITFLVQCFLAVRLQFLNKKLVLASAAIVATGLVAFGAGIALTAELFMTKFSIEAVQGRFFLVTCALDQGAAALCDVIITVSFTLSLLSERYHGAKQTTNVIELLISYMVTRGVLTTIVQILMLAVFCALPTKDVWMLAHLVLSKVYVNTMFAVLNGRHNLRKAIDKTVVLRPIDFGHGNPSGDTSAAMDESFSGTDLNNVRMSGSNIKHDVVIDVPEHSMSPDDHLGPNPKGTAVV